MWGNWRHDWGVFPPPKGRTEEGRPDYSHPVGLADFPAGTYPACQKHGALLCMTPKMEGKPQIWRCDACGAGAIWDAIRR